MTTRGSGAGLWLRFLSGPDIDRLGLASAEIVGAVEGALRAHGEGRHRGLAILDIAVGQLILRRAQQADVGTMLRYRWR